MPRKTSRSVKKDVTESKNEDVAPRRSSRAVTKQEIQTTTTVKDASRSRRSSTAAQTVASVADSKSPKSRSNRRESTSPSDSRSRSGLESPATRVKSTRRNAGRINYKESDGEEETPTPKFDENFESGEDFEETDSDEKSKPRERGKQSKASPKVRESKETARRSTRGRRGRPSKRKSEEIKTLEISDDSMEPEIVETKPAKAEVKESASARTSRGRKSKTEVVDVESEVKPKPSRRSARSTSNKEETPKKRPSRSIQAKRYTEDDEEEIEEITDSTKAEEIDEVDSTRKRKRESSSETANKRLKEDESEPKEKVSEAEEVTDKLEDKEKIVSEKQAEEPMEVEESDSGIVSQEDFKSQESEEISASTEEKPPIDDSKEVEKLPENTDVAEGQEQSSIVKTAEVIPEETKKIEHTTACDTKISEEIKDERTEGSPDQVLEKQPVNQITTPDSDKSSEQLQPMDCASPEAEKMLGSNVIPEANCTSTDLNTKKDLKIPETTTNDINESKNCESKIEPPVTETIVGAASAHSPTENTDSVNRKEKLTNSFLLNSVSEVPSKNLEQSNIVVPKANGAHDVHEGTNSIQEQEQYILPGRKYIYNKKLNENVHLSVKNKTFGFLSYNLGSDFSVQKEKLIHEIRELNPQIICMQQVPKPFYSSVLEPSLDALGYKALFWQPEDSLKGMATFYKISQFRFKERVEISLRHMIDKELETSALEPLCKSAVKTYIKRCGNALLTHLASVIGSQTVNVLNVQIPPSDLSAHALQVSTLAREVIRVNGGTTKPLLIGGEFNISENDASYQLLRDGYLSNDMIDELQKRKDIAVPDKENSSLVDLLWKSFQHPSSNLCSCYSSVLDHELVIPELKKTSSDLLWYSSDSLHTVGIVDVDSSKLGDHHFSLKADIAFSA